MQALSSSTKRYPQQTSAIGFFLVAMAMFPSAQRKAQQEIEAVVGTDRLPTIEDIPAMPYIQATLREVLRWQPTVPLGVPHCVLSDDEYKGYSIPKGTLIVPVSRSYPALLMAPGALSL